MDSPSPEKPDPLSGVASCVADDGAVHRDQGRQSGLPALLPDGRLLRDVLRRRRGGVAGARHHADQARPAPGPRHPDVRRADPRRRPVPPEADRPRPSRRRLRADRGPGRGEEARLQGGGPPRRDPPGHAGHADRGRAPLAGRNNYLAAVSRLRGAGGDGADLFGLAWIDISTGEFRVAESDARAARRRPRPDRRRARCWCPSRSSPIRR